MMKKGPNSIIHALQETDSLPFRLRLVPEGGGKILRQIKSSHLRSFAESPVETDLPFSLRNLFPFYSSSLFPPLHSPKIQCHGQSPPPPLHLNTTHLFGGSKGAADFLLLGRWRRITLFTMCKRLTEFSNRRPGLCRKALLLLLLPIP